MTEPKTIRDAQIIHAAYLRAHAKVLSGAALTDRDFEDAHHNEHTHAMKAAMSLGAYDASKGGRAPAPMPEVSDRVAALTSYKPEEK